jgi:hypothetical protein
LRNASAYLFHHVRDRIHDLAKHSLALKPLPGFAGADPWLLASLLQKAIRRSDLMVARRAAHQLLRLDSSRVWRRLMIVALEDIGIGDTAVAEELIAIATLPEIRKLLGGNGRALDVALKRACEAAKDRSGDHLWSIARDNLGENDRPYVGAESVHLAVAASPRQAWLDRLNAVLALWGDGTQPAETRRAAFGALRAVFEDIGVLLPLLAACEIYAAKARDALPFMLPLVWCLWRGTGAEQSVTTHSGPMPEVIQDLPAYGFDPLHTRIGRRSVELWLRAYLQRPDYSTGQIAADLWNRESALCHRALHWTLGCVFQAQAHRADLLRRGLAPARHSELRAWSVEQASVLHCARQAAWQGALRTAPRPAAEETQMTFEE